VGWKEQVQQAYNDECILAERGAEEGQKLFQYSRYLLGVEVGLRKGAHLCQGTNVALHVWRM
jgi:hypothetical protein